MPTKIGMTEEQYEQYLQARLERLCKKPDMVHYTTVSFESLKWNVEAIEVVTNHAIQKIADTCKGESVSEESFHADVPSCNTAAYALETFRYVLFARTMALIDSVDEPLNEENWSSDWVCSYQADNDFGHRYDGIQKTVAIMRVGVDVDKLSDAQRQSLKTLLDTKTEVLNRKTVEEEALPGAIFDAILLAWGVVYDYDNHKLTLCKAADTDFRSFATRFGIDTTVTTENATALIKAWAAKAYQDIKLITEATPADAIITDDTE